MEDVVAGRGIELPAEPDDGVAFFEEIGIAEVAGDGAGIGRGGGEVEERNHAFVAAVGDFEEDGAVGVGGIAGAEEIEIGGELDLAFGVARGEGEVADQAVGGEIGIDGEGDGSGDAFVGAGGTEGAALLDLGAAADVNGGDGGGDEEGSGDQ